MGFRTILAMCLALPLVAWGQSPAVNGTQDVSSSTQPITTLKMTTRMVAISAVVKGKGGELAGGLGKEDFVLKQDGKEEPIRYFSQGSDLPLTFALMVDTSGSQRTFIGDESLASDVFFETMLGHKEDRAMLVQFDTSVVLLKSMTSSANALHLALSRLDARPATSGGTLLNDAVFTVSQKILATETGRKAMVILSDGGDNGSRKTLDEAIEQAQRADVQVYSILYTLWNGEGATNLGSGLGGIHSTSAIGPGGDALKKLSEATGGRLFTVSHSMSLREIFAQIAQELRLQYELGYTPPADTLPNSYHRLELKAKDKKFAVQARRGFFERP